MFKAKIESFGNAGFLASIENMKGMVVQADTPQNAARKLLMSLKAKIAYDYNIKIDDVQHKEFNSEEEVMKFVQDAKEGESEINLSYCK